MATDIADQEVQEVAWDLEPLVDGDGAAGVERQLEEADRRAATFAEQHAGKVAELDGPAFAAAITELAEISELVGKAGSYAHLDFSIDTSDPARGALLGKVTEQGTAIETKLLFFELEWAALDDERADELLRADGVEIAAHHLRTMRRYRPHLLSEPEEKVLNEKGQTGRGAWARLFGELMAQVKVGEEPLEVALSRLMSPDREVRKTAATDITAALEPGLRTRAFIFNTLSLDKAIDDRMRGFPSWISSRNLSNEASDESVEALVAAVRGRYDLPQRWYRLKAKLLGIDKLADYDRMASLTQDDTRIGWAEGRELVLDSYGSFSPELGALAKQFFDDRWIDAPVRDGKRGGAFCAYTVPERAPVRDAQLDVAPARRPDARPRARPRRARRARAAAGRLPAGHAADAGRDRVGVRRGARLRPPARGDRPPSRACRCWPRRSRARSPRCSARSP
jgi:oligoendopeptidase F